MKIEVGEVILDENGDATGSGLSYSIFNETTTSLDTTSRQAVAPSVGPYCEGLARGILNDIFEPGPRQLSLSSCKETDGYSHYTIKNTGNVTFWEQNDVATYSYLVCDIVGVPHGARLTAASLLVQGATHGALPDVMPAMWIRRSDGSGGYTNVGSGTDGSGSVGAYAAVHQIAATFDHTMDSAYRYWVVFRGEYSTNAAAGLKFLELSVTCGAP